MVRVAVLVSGVVFSALVAVVGGVVSAVKTCVVLRVVALEVKLVAD